MKLKLFTLIIIATIQFGYSQKKGIIYYGNIEALGIGNAKGIDSNSYMLFNNEQSYYVTAKDSLENLIEKDKEKLFLDEKQENNSISLGMKTSPQGDQVVYNIKKNTIWSNFLHRKQIYVKEVATKINWKIEKESKKIGEFSCKKATANFRGRNYTVWFTTQIPLPFGPWKLNGLPGLILEAYDKDKYVYWYFKSVKYPSTISENVRYMKIPKHFNFKSYEEFKEFQKEQINITIDKQKIAQKSYPGVIFEDPKLINAFIECE